MHTVKCNLIFKDRKVIDKILNKYKQRLMVLKENKANENNSYEELMAKVTKELIKRYEQE